MNRQQTIDQANATEGWFEPEDINAIYDIVSGNATKGGRVVEVGSWKGRSTYAIAGACEEVGAKLTCIDSFKGLLLGPEHIKWNLYHGDNGYYSEGNTRSILPDFKKNVAEFLDKGIITIVEGDSRTAHKDLKDESCDVVFIDGDHDEPVIGQDLDNYYKKVKPGGVFCGDDYEAGNNVSQSLDTFMERQRVKGNDQLRLLPTNSTLWLMRKPE